VHHDDLGATCSCPHAESGWFCKHMVAAGLAFRDHLNKYGVSTWRLALSRALDTTSKSSKGPKVQPYWFFVSLQHESEGWRLFPFIFQIDKVQEGILPDASDLLAENLPELVAHNQWILKHVREIRTSITPEACVNCDPNAIAMANLLQNQGRYRQNIYYYAYTYPLADYLTMLSRMAVPLFLGTYRNPLGRHLQMDVDPGDFRLKIERTDAGVHLAANLVVGDDRIVLDHENTEVLTQGQPVWVMAGDRVFSLVQDLPVERLVPWLRTPELNIPTESEDEFLESYLPILAEQYPLEGEQVTWLDVESEPVKRLYLSDQDGELQASLRFGYGGYEVPYVSIPPTQSVQRKQDAWTLVRIHRQPGVEAEIYRSVSSAAHGIKRGGASQEPGTFVLRARVHPIDFLMRHVPRLTESGFEIYGEEKLKTARVNRNQPTLSLNVSSGIDWFDIQAMVQFGDVEASLDDVRKALRRKEHYIKLADGTIGEIPDEWIKRYKHLFGLGEQTKSGIRLSNHHLTLIDQLMAEADGAKADAEYSRRRQRLLDFSGIVPQALPSGFIGELRPYQKSGYDWLHFLHDYEFGGCLADDMGLGKTIEALVFLLSLRKAGHATSADLIVVPRSLLINWQREAARFTPGLTTYLHFGKDRLKNPKVFNEYDLVFTTYGIMRRDIEKLRGYKFHYIILDESQAIKNPLTKTAKAARLLRSDHRLALTGTPVENTTFELWSLLAFLNPGLLGSLEYFRREFGNPIERQGDEDASSLLRKMVYPFILRRTKEQVAPELPPRTERIIFGDMEPAQRKFYNRTRDYYRALLLEMLEEKGLQNTRMKVLEGLLRLRQICNHPKLVKGDFRGASAKFELLFDTIETLQAEGHKALVFSQFVQMLTLVRKELDQRGIPYVYLDGRTRKRQDRVDTFQNDPDIPFFLISLKAGGVGLNLTAADYVLHIDPWWNPAVEMQATDRTHRIGQDKPVFVYKLITRDSVEEKILQLQERKKALVEQLITTESSFFKDLDAEDVRVLFS
jgi:non-specific serine/threonine protein kinase